MHKQVDMKTFQPIVVIVFAADAKQAAIEWLMARIQASKDDDGANLQPRMVVMKYSKDGTDTEVDADEAVETMLYIGASLECLLLAAEQMQLKKAHIDGYHKSFTLAEFKKFKGSASVTNFFSLAEKQRIVQRELEGIRAGVHDQNIPGYKFHLYPGKSIIKKYISRDIVLQMFPLHDEDDLKYLSESWCGLKKTFTPQPIHEVQQYFGEKISIYFAFLGLYTISLICPAIIGILYFVTSWNSVYREAIFAIFNLVWSTIFLEAWKRYSAELTYKWGVVDTMSTQFEEPRADYYGHIGTNVITGKVEPVYPRWKRVMRLFMITVPVLFVCLSVTFFLMVTYFWTDAYVKVIYKEEPSLVNYCLLYTPTAVYAIAIVIIGSTYRSVAMKLNNMENHRLQSSYDNAITIKLVMFNFVNCFMSLFYVAFYLQDMTLLRSHLAHLLIISQVLGQLQESVLPFFTLRRRTSQIKNILKNTETMQIVSGSNDLCMTVQKQANVEATMEAYDGPMDDYLELFLQFGYVYLFSSAFPLAALLALLNNITEIRSDAFKMCKIFQRPFAERTSNIGAWQIAFEVIGVISVITNCALIGMNPEIQKLMPSNITEVNIVLIFVAVEHIVLAVKVMLTFLIPDMPRWVRIELARQEYQDRLQSEMKASATSEILVKDILRPHKLPTTTNI